MDAERLAEYDVLILAAALEAGEPSGAERISVLSGVPKSTVYRRLESLKADGFLTAAKQRDGSLGRPQEVFTPTRKAYEAISSEAVRLAQEASRLGAIINSLPTKPEQDTA